MPLGHTNNPNGRPPGRVNRRTQEILDLIKERGDTDPLVALSSIVTTNGSPRTFPAISRAQNLCCFKHLLLLY